MPRRHFQIVVRLAPRARSPHRRCAGGRRCVRPGPHTSRVNGDRLSARIEGRPPRVHRETRHATARNLHRRIRSRPHAAPPVRRAHRWRPLSGGRPHVRSGEEGMVQCVRRRAPPARRMGPLARPRDELELDVRALPSHRLQKELQRRRPTRTRRRGANTVSVARNATATSPPITRRPPGRRRVPAAQAGISRRPISSAPRKRARPVTRATNCSPASFGPASPITTTYRLTLPTEAAVFYPDGQMRDEDFNYTSLLTSRMGGKAGVTCLDCHDPHSGRTKLPVENNALCLQCHGPSPRNNAPIIDPLAHSHHAADNKGNQCVSCHMPTTTYMQRDPAPRPRLPQTGSAAHEGARHSQRLQSLPHRSERRLGHHAHGPMVRREDGLASARAHARRRRRRKPARRMPRKNCSR